MKRREQCPECAVELESREVAPCYQCGAAEDEVEAARAGRHEYSEYDVFTGLRLVLCTVCFLEMSGTATFFGVPRGKSLKLDDLRFLHRIPSKTVRDKVCPSCRRRRKWIGFIADAKVHNATDPNHGLRRKEGRVNKEERKGS